MQHMQQHYSQQHLAPSYPPQQRNVSSSPMQRQFPVQPFTPTQNLGGQNEGMKPYSTDMRERSRQMQNTPQNNAQSMESMALRIQTLEKENQSLKRQLENANQQIQALNQKVNQNATPSLLKTTTFELVVLQKAVEQLEGLKNGLQKKKLQGSNNQTTIPDSQKEGYSELKSKVTVMEEKQQQLERQQSQNILLFPKEQSIQNQQSNPPSKEEVKEEPRQGRRIIGNSQSDQVDNQTKVSPIKYLNVKAGTSQNALRVSPRRKPDLKQN
ncbi:unnamed protein product (macronuclear) [Paramecium tetraurelia]|uniref:Uncharacterized protein n=1 Tax=Paramecium tetraurelia TaxID=5888 RepID=A0DHJ5_PARTE|nr:uncharacterized protein GSPATT00016899001 [Paramecium tetraurelia]CAK82512.1 unnamed protein product [Paramecium tetraurelia]|eukprot:XP_001449909.1 hypothetical protein (macronuclear) [Paramecium tetraurelia strain d4-2]